MVSDDNKSVLLFHPYSIDPVVLEKAKESIGENEERLEQTVVIIREWLKKQPHLTYPSGGNNIIIRIIIISLLKSIILFLTF